MAKIKGQKNFSEKEKADAVEMVRKGHKPEEVARMLGAGPSTVFGWVTKDDMRKKFEAMPDAPTQTKVIVPVYQESGAELTKLRAQNAMLKQLVKQMADSL